MAARFFFIRRNFVGRKGRVQRPRRWQLGLLTVLIVFASLVLVVTASAIALVALPIVLIGSAAYRVIRVRRTAPRRPGSSDSGVIDGEYRVVDAAEAGDTGQSKTRAPEDGAAEAAMGRV